MVEEIAHWMPLIPLVWLFWRNETRHPIDAAWWWLACAFAVSWLADTAADFTPVQSRWVISLVYPVTQAALIGAVLLFRKSALILLAVLVAAGIASALLFGVEKPDLVLRTIASLAVVGMIWNRPALPMRLRLTLFVYFGLGLIAWAIHVRWLIVATWYPVQLVRLSGLILFCWAATEPRPPLYLSRR